VEWAQMVLLMAAKVLTLFFQFIHLKAAVVVVR
jgi:hypothetical protein